jgi:hypothetical protein
MRRLSKVAVIVTMCIVAGMPVWGSGIEGLYASADVDGDGCLSGQEFQEWLWVCREWLPYVENEVVLSPMAYVLEGGGDCDDWATLVADFLEWWGYDAWVVFTEGGGSGHSVVGVREAPERLVRGLGDEWWLLDREWYWMVDWDVPGGLTSASEGKEPWGIYRPSEVVGMRA